MSTPAPRPTVRPNNPNFSSGPCSKRPGWSIDSLANALTGRSHRAKPGKARLLEVIDRTRAVLGIPDDYRIGIVPASDTGAVEMVLWSVLGPRGVDMLAWESFGSGWITDVTKQLKLPDVRAMTAEYGELPDLKQVDFTRDVVFTWNGTTSGVCVPNGDWIPTDRQGLTICDATSAVFAMDLPWDKLDATTWSWQKVMGGEAAHGMLVLSPRAVERLETYTPSWPMPKIFRMTKGGKLIDGIFKGETINTPSMIAVEDALDGLKWAVTVGGQPGLIKRSQDNLDVITNWVDSNPSVAFLAGDAKTRSRTSVCLKIVAPWFTTLSAEDQAKAAKRLVAILDEEGVAYDIGAYRDAPAGLRIWAGSTVESEDLEALFPWLDWAIGQVEQELTA
ncbi:MAG: phosphoserine transaminase [Rhodospirillales bacterium]|nr:phosphoserine transaminase [Rhodospirillales bacterium]MCW8952307.1 phosphoserine transaminase [Rhodospirillales bacterium]MCW8970945.1 phosphoserine transaminase [Rhodospirillales bacterium]MCW9003199.1 phosphoserine transaminase [Rhodospirillales bacterium]MCW9039357.1 phosphoserine transaminase [Rhodospirillales bacterium]